MIRAVNPYRVGSPLRGEEEFFGRQDTLTWVSRELRNPGTNALVLAGQRRIGKTSLLLRLERTLSGEYFLPLYFDLQNKASHPLSRVLAALTSKIVRRAGCEMPDIEAFDDEGRFFQHIFLPQLYQALDKDRRPVFLLDEFDVLDQAKEELPENAATLAFFPFLRSVMDEDPRPAFVFALGRQAEDLSTVFTALLKGALNREIWVLDKESTISLILQAQANGTLHFTDRAVERIWRLTSGHPYMTQLLCQRIWERAYTGEKPDAPPRVDVPDVEAAVPGALEAGRPALAWLWQGLNPAERVYAAALAEAAGEEDETISENQIVQVLAAHAARLRTPPVELAPRKLVKRRVLEEYGEREYRFAVEFFRRWVRRYQPLRDVKDELDRMYEPANRIFNVGQQFFRDGEWDKAIRYFKDALEKEPSHFQARLQLGEALLKIAQADAAVAELERAYKLDLNEARWPLARALLAQAEARGGAGDEDGALAACMQVLEISPGEKAAQGMKDAIWTRRGNAAIEQGDMEAALAAYRQTGAEGWTDAVALVRQALESDPSLFRTRFHLGEILLELGQIEEAMAELDTALDVYRRASADRQEETIDFFQLLLAREPHNVFARLHLGELLMARGQISEAVHQLEQAYDLDSVRARPHLVRALVAQAQAAQESGDRLAVMKSYVRVMQVDPSHRDALEVIEKTIAELQQEMAVTGLTSVQAWRPDRAYAAPRINGRQLGEILRNAESRVRLLGVVALDPDWPTLAKEWAGKLTGDTDFEVTILCESDNFLFSKAFTLDTDTARHRRSFRELKFIRDRATADFPALLLEEGASSEIVGKKIDIEIMHLPMPFSIAQVDDKVFANLWLHEVEDFFEEITRQHPWRSLLEEYVSTYFDPERGRKYARSPGDEVLELFDHKRIPRGIYPRRSFYDTDHSQLVVWAFVFDRQGRLLIHRRSDNAQDNQGMWDKSVGGHVEFTDLDTSRAAFREVIEELFIKEPEEVKSDLKKWVVSDEEVVFLGDWRPGRRKWYPFREIRSFNREWAYFRLRESEPLYSPRTLPDGTVRRLRVIPDIFFFVAGPQLTDEFLDNLENSTFKLIEISELKSTMDKALGGEAVPGFDENRFGEVKPVPEFTPDLVRIMTGKLRDVLEEFSQYIKRYIRVVAQ